MERKDGIKVYCVTMGPSLFKVKSFEHPFLSWCPRVIVRGLSIPYFLNLVLVAKTLFCGKQQVLSRVGPIFLRGASPAIQIKGSRGQLMSPFHFFAFWFPTKSDCQPTGAGNRARLEYAEESAGTHAENHLFQPKVVLPFGSLATEPRLSQVRGGCSARQPAQRLLGRFFLGRG